MTYERLRTNMYLRDWEIVDSAAIEEAYKEYQKTVAYAKETARASNIELIPSARKINMAQG